MQKDSGKCVVHCLHRPTEYAFVYGHVGHFEGRNVVDAICVRPVTDPHRAFKHALDVCAQHAFFAAQEKVQISVKHERGRDEEQGSRAAQKRRVE